MTTVFSSYDLANHESNNSTDEDLENEFNVTITEERDRAFPRLVVPPFFKHSLDSRNRSLHNTIVTLESDQTQLKITPRLESADSWQKQSRDALINAL